MAVMGIGEKVKMYREALGLSQPELAAKIGVKQATISQLENGVNKGSKHLPRIAAELGVTVAALDESLPATIITAALVGLPIRGEVRAGAWLEIDDQPEALGRIPMAPDIRYKLQRQYALRVVGTSMNKVAKPGVFVVVADWSDNGAELQDGDLVVVRRERDHTYEVTLKRAKMGRKAWELWPESDDPKHQEPLKLEHDNPEWTVSVIGKVIGKYEPL